MGEWSTFTDDKESSGEDGKDSKKEPKKKLVPPLIVPPAPRPPLFEQLVTKEVTKDDDDDKEESSKDKSEDKDDSAEGQPEAVEAEPASPDEQSGEQPVVDQVAEAAEAPATPDDEWEGELRLHDDQPEAGAELPLEAAEEDAETAASARSTSSGPSPTPPPIVPPPSAPQTSNQARAFGWNTGPSPNTGFNFNTAPNPVAATAELLQDTAQETERAAEKRALRKGLIAGFLTGYVVKAYIANRRHERYEKTAQKQINQRDEQIANFQREQQRLTEKMAAQTAEYRSKEQLAKEQTARLEKLHSTQELSKQPPEQHIFDQQGNEIILQPGWKVERSSGGYSVVLDEHNRIVHDAIRYGEAFKREQQREQLSDDVFATLGGGASASGPINTGYGPVPPAGQAPGGQPYGQSPIPASRGTVDLKHRLPQPRNRVAATLFGPWIWTIIAVLIIVYFIAQLA